MNDKKTRGVTLVELVCAIGILAIISGGLAAAFVANQGMSMRAHRTTMAVFEAQFQLERITGLMWTGSARYNLYYPDVHNYVFDLLYPRTRIVVGGEAGLAIDEIDSAASWGDVFSRNGFNIKITREPATAWGAIDKEGFDGPGMMRVWVHIFEPEDDPDVDHPKLTLEGAINIDQRMDRINKFGRNTGRFYTSTDMFVNPVAHPMLNTLPGVTNPNVGGPLRDIDILQMSPGVPALRLRAEFVVHDTYLDEYVVVMVTRSPTGNVANFPNLWQVSGSFEFVGNCRLNGLEFELVTQGEGINRHAHILHFLD